MQWPLAKRSEIQHLTQLSESRQPDIARAGTETLVDFGDQLRIAHLYDAALGRGSAHGDPAESAKVMAGAILFRFTAIGFLDGYVVTAAWYQKKIANLTTT
ncbi:MAG: hypothetical protein WB565_13250 [Acidimicrobiales bacterium]